MKQLELKEMWTDWSRRIRSEVQWLQDMHCIYRRLLDLIEENPQIDRTNPLIWWMFINYGHSALMNVRRLTEPRKRNINVSLHVLVQ